MIKGLFNASSTACYADCNVPAPKLPPLGSYTLQPGQPAIAKERFTPAKKSNSIFDPSVYKSSLYHANSFISSNKQIYGYLKIRRH